jgi:hypothetical protein
MVIVTLGMIFEAAVVAPDRDRSANGDEGHVTQSTVAMSRKLALSCSLGEPPAIATRLSNCESGVLDGESAR